MTDDQLLTVYLHGLVSGVVTVLAGAGASDQRAKTHAWKIADSIRRDPAAQMVILDMIHSGEPGSEGRIEIELEA